MARDTTEDIIRRRTEYEYLRTQLRNERQSFVSHWRLISEFIRPRRARFFSNDNNKGDRRHTQIIDSTGLFASRSLTAGMMAGLTSPGRRWFMLEPEDPIDIKKQDVKIWNEDVTDLMGSVFSRSNLYKVLPPVYDDVGTFATGCMMAEEDFDKVVKFRSFPVGSYMIGTNSWGEVNVFMREYQMTVRQVVDTFGRPDGGRDIDWSNLSMSVKSLYEANNTESWIDIVHCIKPNDMYDPSKLESKYKKFSSVYYEQGVSRGTSGNSSIPSSDNVREKFLRESGYDIFPVMAPRWSVSGEDIYGTSCPGMIALGDVKQLQRGEKRSLQALDKQVSPPMTAPASLRNSKASILPGDITFLDRESQNEGFKPAYQVVFDYQGLEHKQEQVRQRINKAYFVDLFFSITDAKKMQKTAREVDALEGEKLLGIGPVVHQFAQDLFDPLIDITYHFLDKQGRLPEPPEEIQGKNLKVKYVSVLANAQKLVAIESLDRLANFITGMSEVKPDILDKIDEYELADEYADVTSAPPKVIRNNEDAQIRREQRQQQIAQAQQAETMKAEAAAAKDLSQANLSEDNALTNLVGASNQEAAAANVEPPAEEL